MENRRKTGTEYEALAAAYLEDRGYTILERNFHDKYGEIDLIAKEENQIVFVEVKYRRNLAKGDPAEAVNYPKQQRIRRTARYYLYHRGLTEETPCRFDVVAILGREIRLLKDAF